MKNAQSYSRGSYARGLSLGVSLAFPIAAIGIISAVVFAKVKDEHDATTIAQAIGIVSVLLWATATVIIAAVYTATDRSAIEGLADENEEDPNTPRRRPRRPAPRVESKTSEEEG
jgi:hypothetical protein